MAVSQNGWSANDRSVITTWTIPGTSRQVNLRAGDAGWLLCDFAAWFDKNVESIDSGGVMDDWGFAERPIRGGVTLSNHASGTAIDLNATRHPLGRLNTYTPQQITAIHGRLARYGGALRWGGDYSGRRDEMHFEINASAAVVAHVAAQLKDAQPDNTVEVDVAALPLLKTGASGAPVRVLQGLLNAAAAVGLCQAVDIDGSFGPATDLEVKGFQGAFHLDVDGVVGQNTYTHLLAL